jgi:hypothetical protein
VVKPDLEWRGFWHVESTRASEIDKSGKNQKNQNDADFYRYLPKSQLKMRA